MANDIVNGFVSPGYAVSNALQEILTQQKLDRHQALMDEIAQQNAEMQRQNAEVNRREMEARMKNYEAESRRFDEQANDSYAQQFGMGQTLTPEDEAGLRQHNRGGMIVSTPEERPSEDFVGPMPSQQTFAGSPKDRYLAEQGKKLMELRRSEEFNNSDAFTQWAMATALGIRGLEPKDFQKPESTTGPFRTIHPITGVITEHPEIQVPRTQPPMKLDVAPQGPRPQRSSEALFDAEGNYLGERMTEDGKTRFIPKDASFPSGPMFRTPPSKSEKPKSNEVWDGASGNTMIRDINKAKEVIATARLDKDRREAMQSLRANLDTAIATANLSPQGQNMLRAVVEDMKNVGDPRYKPSPYTHPKMTAATIAQFAVSQGKIPPEEEAKLARAIQQLRGR